MSEATPPSNEQASEPTGEAIGEPTQGLLKADEISIADIDKLLSEEDPDFTQALQDVRAVEADALTEIQALAGVPYTAGPEGVAESAKAKMREAKKRVQEARQRARQSALDFLVGLKTAPQRFLKLVKSALAAARALVLIPVALYKRASRIQVVAFASTAILSISGVVLLRANLRGVWVPALQEPIIRSLADVADARVEFDGLESTTFSEAFPQEAHDYLFPKFKMNLRPTEDHPHPMGAFEIILSMDSKDAAIEVSGRETELYDLAQRVLEEETYDAMATEAGKRLFKDKLRRQLNQKMTSGFVQDVSFKTFVLKP